MQSDDKCCSLLGSRENTCCKDREGAYSLVHVPPLAGAQHCSSRWLSTSCCLLLLSSANPAGSAGLSIRHRWDTLLPKFGFPGHPTPGLHLMPGLLITPCPQKHVKDILQTLKLCRYRVFFHPVFLTWSCVHGTCSPQAEPLQPHALPCQQRAQDMRAALTPQEGAALHWVRVAALEPMSCQEPQGCQGGMLMEN